MLAGSMVSTPYVELLLVLSMHRLPQTVKTQRELIMLGLINVETAYFD